MLSVFGLTVLALVGLNLYTQFQHAAASQQPGALTKTGAATSGAVLVATLSKLELEVLPLKRRVWRGRFGSRYAPKKGRLYLGDAEATGLAATVMAALGAARAERRHQAGAFVWYERLVPLVNQLANLSVWAVISGTVLNLPLAQVLGVTGFLLGFVFHLFTLPVPFDTTRLALEKLETLNFAGDDLSRAKHILNVATFSAFSSLVVTVLFPFELLLAIAEDWREAEKAKSAPN